MVNNYKTRALRGSLCLGIAQVARTGVGIELEPSRARTFHGVVHLLDEELQLHHQRGGVRVHLARGLLLHGAERRVHPALHLELVRQEPREIHGGGHRGIEGDRPERIRPGPAAPGNARPCLGRHRGGTGRARGGPGAVPSSLGAVSTCTGRYRGGPGQCRGGPEAVPRLCPPRSLPPGLGPARSVPAPPAPLPHTPSAPGGPWLPGTGWSNAAVDSLFGVFFFFGCWFV